MAEDKKDLEFDVALLYNAARDHNLLTSLRNLAEAAGVDYRKVVQREIFGMGDKK